MGETGQPLHARVNGYQFDITHWRTDVSLVAESFNCGAHLDPDMPVVVIGLSTSRDPCLQKVKEARLISTLETLSPSKINLQVDSMYNLPFRISSAHL